MNRKTGSSIWGRYDGAVSLTFDDGLACQLDLAIPAMDKLGIKGTFYLRPNGKDWAKRLAPWRAVADNGHEIGNHSIMHAGPANFQGLAGLDYKTLADVESDVLEARERLSRIAPRQKQWTFCYPCYCTYVGRGESRQSYVPIIARHFLAARGGGEYGIANHPLFVDLSCAAGLATDRMSGNEMIGLVETLAGRGEWVILVFHEFNGARLTVGMHDFNLLLQHLARFRNRIWAAPMAEVARKIAMIQKKAAPVAKTEFSARY